MKKLQLVIFFIMIFYSANASAVESDPDMPMPSRCFIQAKQMGLSTYQSILLCANGTTLDPIHCFQGLPKILTPDQGVNLCQGATSQAPLHCFGQSIDLGLSFDQQIKLCNTAPFSQNSDSDHDVTTAPAKCFRQALTFPLTQDQRVILCSDADSDNPVLCFNRADFLNLSPDQRVRLCTQLPPSGWN